MKILKFVISEQDVEQYADISGDHNPIHLDLDEAKQQGFPNKIAHGMLTMAKVWSAISQGVLSPTDFPSQYEFAFLSPVFIGDHLTLTVSQIDKQYLLELKNSLGIVGKGSFILEP